MIKKSNNIPGDYQYHALNYANFIQRQWHKNRHNLIKYLNFLQAEDFVLDAGCGSGNIILEFSSNVKSITGIDNNKDCVTFINKKTKEKHIKNAKALEMDLLNLSFKNKKFTKIIMTEILEHFSQKQSIELLKNIKKILTPQGKILVTTPNYKSPWFVIELLIDSFKLSPKLWGEQHLVRFTSKRLNSLLKESGFLVEKTGTLNCISPFIAPINFNLADKLSFLEFKYFPLGNLLYAVAANKQ